MSHDGDFLPWQTAQAQSWLQHRERFAHAWLIHGLRGIGQLEFALAGARSLLCETPQDGLACGHCQACRWVDAGNHPDLRRIRPDVIAQHEGSEVSEGEEGGGSKKKQPSRDIRIEQIRALLPWFNVATHRAGWRVAILYPAERLNVVSANALLKVLEEPPEHTVFLIVADAPDRLLPTLVSRCRRLPLPVPSRSEAEQWLKAQGIADAGVWLDAVGGAPMLAVERAAGGVPAYPPWLDDFLDLCRRDGDAGPLADQLAAMPTADWIDGFQRMMTDLSLAAHNAPVRYFPSRAQAIQAVATAADRRRLASAARWLLTQRRLSGQALNPKFLADHGVSLLTQACRPAAHDTEAS
ncbi:MAG: DNA polymerase III subunit delta' [Alcaligenaceae bacterium]|nr:DNA polymerase III subunit delta' [Alcaligenaceae bacterium]